MFTLVLGVIWGGGFLKPEIDLARFLDKPGIVILGVVRLQDQLEIAMPEHLDHYLPGHSLLRHR